MTVFYQPRDGFLPPGSDRARAAGCRCPVLDNNHGRFPLQPPDEAFPDGAWWITSDCPLHGIPSPMGHDPRSDQGERPC